MFKKKKQFKDSDADGLMDDQEKKLGTDPLSKDSDNDELDDYEEVNVYHTDPLKADTDADGIKDGQEVKMGRNPKGPGLLHDLFIPSSANNYKPQALHPKRLFFHALGLVGIKLVLVVFLLAFPVTAWLTPNILTEQSNKIVSLTNSLRANLNIHQLEESAVLRNAAWNKAQDMLINQYFAHLSPENKNLKYWLAQQGYSYQYAGENLALGFSEPQQVVDAWVKSPTHYANLIDTDYTQIGVAMVSGEYNGGETSLVAQYFGVPKVEQAVVEEEEPVIEVPIVEEEPTVLSEKETALGIPELQSPTAKLINNSVVNLRIYAPQADRVEVIDNSTVIGNFKVYYSYLVQDIELTEGEHKLVIKAIRAEESNLSSEYIFNIDTTGPVVDQEKSNIMANSPVGQDNLVVKAEVYLSEDTVEAMVQFSDYELALTKDYTEDNSWSASTILENVETLEPVVPATLIAKDQAGNITTESIKWSEIVPTKATVVNQYMFLKTSPAENIKPLFNFSNLYFKIILGLAIFALLLNVFVKIRKQHASVIVSSILFILLLGVLTIF